MKHDTELEDAELISRLVHPDKIDAAITYLYQAHFESLSRYIINNSGSFEDAQDVFQETITAFVFLIQQNRFRGESSIRTFLFSMNKNIWLNELKRRDRSAARSRKYEQLGRDEGETAAVTLEKREARKLLQKTMEALDEPCRKILVLFYFEKQPMKDILSVLHYENEQVVRNKKHKCLKKLESLIGAQKNLFQQLKTLFHG